MRGRRVRRRLEGAAPSRRRPRRIIGQVTPPEELHIDVRSGDRTHTARTDALGRFVAEEITEGPMSPRLRSDLQSVVTKWVVILSDTAPPDRHQSR
jgi:hypothetical protein